MAINKINIELRRLQIFDRMSEETTAFAADLYIDGIKCGYAENQGHGGCTNYGPIQPFEKTKPLIAAAEAYCKSLPDIVYPASHGMEEFSMACTLEHTIDDIVEKAADAKENIKFEKAKNKKMLSAIIIGHPENAGQYSFVAYKIPIEEILRKAGGKEAIQKSVAKIKAGLKPGEQILNTNLPADILDTPAAMVTA